MTEASAKRGNLTRLLTMVSTSVTVISCIVFSLLIIKGNLNVARVSGGLKNKTPAVIIDAGHGGEDGGAISKTGITEKYINLFISQKVQDYLHFFGYETIMTRNEDKLFYDETAQTTRQKKVSDIMYRMNIIEENPNSVFLSIHQNHYDGETSTGTQVFYSEENTKSEAFAKAIQETVVNDIQPLNQRQTLSCGNEIYLLSHSPIPSVMVECGFLSNKNEADMLNTEEYQNQMAFEIVKGTMKFIGEEYG